MPRPVGLLEESAAPSRVAEPAVVIRVSTRAKRLTLKVVPPYRLELVVPRRTRPRAVEEFLATHRDWIGRALAELESRYPVERRRLPSRISLQAIGRDWRVDIEACSAGRSSLDDRGDHLDLRVPERSEDAAFELLRVWLLRQGRIHLKPWLAREAGRLELEPSRVQIRTQRTRWGSCSQHGSISLNAALLLLPEPLVRYLLVHELCHLRHLDHSQRYWRLVERFEPEYRVHDRALAGAWTDIPVWALPG